ncbi:uncharacterized protein LOC143542838 [Bidens hawaiensis]|uniref:uncharacterized protein LOC143542838 n=1 Tax=Bidens hawaiensis TaxID=980011 RepID=UPI00404969BA
MDEDYIPMDNFAEDEMDLWDEKDPEIRLNMYFTSKAQVDYAVRMWNINHNREIYMEETRSKVFTAKCKKFQTNKQPAQCLSTMSLDMHGKKIKRFHCFKMTAWTPAHSCFTIVSRNNNRALRSKVVAAHIQQQVLANLSYTVKQILSLIKEKLNVDITYGKAWTARKKAIKNIYDSWDENFHELPSYIMALQQTNPGTVVKWLHHPYSPSDYSVVKGTYKGKILMAVSKNTNNMILSIAYVLVDEETNESWEWFIQQFADNVEDRARRKLCVISDRHAGIKHAMDKLESWKEPHAYHRFCLRHVRSNFMAKFECELEKDVLGDRMHNTMKKV